MEKRSNAGFYRRAGMPALIIAAILYGLVFIGWLVFGGLLLLSYTPDDVPFVYLAMCVYPPTALGSLVIGFVLYRQNRFPPAFFVLFLPLISIFFALVAYSTIWF